MRYRLTIALMLAWVGVGGAGQRFKDEIESLKGLAGVEVFIEIPNPEIGKDGLSNGQLQTDAELRLRKVGIKVLSEEENIKTPGMPILYVKVSSVKNKDGLYAYSLKVELLQSVVLSRDRSLELMAMSTWRADQLATVGVNNMPASVRSEVGDLIDAFVNDYLAANPVKR